MSFRSRSTSVAAAPARLQPGAGSRPLSCSFQSYLPLRRIRATATQTDLPAAQRHRNVRDAFAVTRAAASLVGAVVVLVDDVSTTGATLEVRCARVLKEAE